ncbi:MAG: hypothetical protein COV60_02500 [Candidatus Magasanikbacteria bacterium CG11_big_fil_rev_8_21_14_0_20_43_7]|uniref:Uncharacterized protein n=1 Tax=Candidatus Magasanikbacteria bacterium CG11_big_fil_rev_8_21_14_0_20_43_7 TaxID=1974654 RepID=A0A2H0N2A2_9BACT|nr:MAG: hypothetical protein COV60_02500 [Candidatus Magasanikbacteria bacterium CG11_big_fil_rev_8_21_14_0_20_43_7]
MLKKDDIIEIQGPPIDEIQKRSSCLKQGCVSVLFFVFLTLMFCIISIHFFVKPNTKQHTVLPDNFPKNIPLYDSANVDQMSYTSGAERGQAIELLAFVPKAILSPIILALERTDVVAGAQTEYLWDSFIRILGTPVSDHRNIVRVHWSEVQANPRFFHSYYKTALEEHGFVEMAEKNNGSIHFTHDTGITVYLTINDDGIEKNGTDYVILTVYYPSI